MTLDLATEYLLLLANYDAGTARDIERRYQAGMDITDELYEQLCIHDELAAEDWLGGSPAPQPHGTGRRCQLCGEETTQGNQAEMYDPDADIDVPSVYCHDQCGLEKGLVIA